MLRNHHWRMAIMLLVFATSSWAAGFEDDEAEKVQWAEQEVSFPAAPVPANLVEINVGPTATNRFLVDPVSVSVGADGVIRYTLVIDTGSARNISYEGMRCETRERRLYASGRPDGSWSKSRNHRWDLIREGGANRYHAALFIDYFCPWGVIVNSTEEARDALRKGGHPSMNRR